MKRLIYTLSLSFLLLAGYSPVQAQSDLKEGYVRSEHFAADRIDDLKISGYFEVHIQQGTQTGVIIDIDSTMTPYLTCKLDDGSLSLGINSKYLTSKNSRKGNTPQVKAYITISSLKGLNLSGSADVYFTGEVSGEKELVINKSGSTDIHNLIANGIEQIKLNASGAGDAQVKLTNSQEVRVLMSGSGRLDLSGQCQELNTTLSGSGQVSAFDMAAETVLARLSGSGRLNVWPTKSLDAKASGSGSVIYKGSPAVKQQTSGSAKVTAYIAPL